MLGTHGLPGPGCPAVHHRLIVSSSTRHPNSRWVVKQTEAFIEQTKGRTEKPAIVMHDRDTKFTKEFVTALKIAGIRTNALPVASPNLNGRCERFIQSLKRECLLRFIVFGQRHLDHLVAEWVTYYNTRRSHMVRGHLPPIREVPEEVPKLDRDQIVVRSYVATPQFEGVEAVLRLLEPMIADLQRRLQL